MSDQSKVPPLYWIVTEDGSPIVVEGRVAGRQLDFFSFFTTREKAQRHYDQSYMTNKRITSSDDPTELRELVESRAPDRAAFLIDAEGFAGPRVQPLLAQEILQIVEDNVGAPEWYLGY